LSPVTVEAIELVKSSLKKVDCELFGHVRFVTSPISHSCAYLDLSVNLAFRSRLGFKNKCRARAGFGLAVSGFKMKPVYNSNVKSISY